MGKITKEPKDFEDVDVSWGILLEKIADGSDFEICSIKPRKKIQYFHAKVNGQCIIVDRAEEHVETARINGDRRIDFNQFRCVAQLYNRYVLGTTGIRPMMINHCGLNTSYIISLIHHLL